MELDIQELSKETEEKEAQAATKEAQASKEPSIATSSAIDKGKSPMEDIPHESIDQ